MCVLAATEVLISPAFAEPQALRATPVEKPARMPADPDSYLLTPRDVVHIKVFQEEELETTARIGKDGTIPFPLLGSAKIGGETLHQATSTMEQLLHKYLIQPQVDLSIVEYSKRHFTILGQVNRPGTIDMPDDTTVNLLEAIGMAGGYTRIANPSKVTVKRLVQGKETIFKLDGKNMLKETGPRFEVEPGDTIYVGEALF